MDYLFWSTTSELWRSKLDGSEALLLLNRDLGSVGKSKEGKSYCVLRISTYILSCADDIAVDWIGSKLYWTDNGLDRIGVMDFLSGHYSILVNTGAATSPRGIIVDPISR